MVQKPDNLVGLEQSAAGLTFAAYQQKALSTAVYDPQHNVIYPALGLANEAGEVLGKIKKVLRDNDGEFAEYIDDIAAELGDVLWYIATLADDLGIELPYIAQANLNKLSLRQERGTLQGSGDDR